MECPENQPRAIGYRLVTTGVESLTSVALTDEDGDGVLTGTQTFPRFPLAARSPSRSTTCALWRPTAAPSSSSGR